MGSSGFPGWCPCLQAAPDASRVPWEARLEEAWRERGTSIYAGCDLGCSKDTGDGHLTQQGRPAGDLQPTLESLRSASSSTSDLFPTNEHSERWPVTAQTPVSLPLS